LAGLLQLSHEVRDEHRKNGGSGKGQKS
jgi:hypothetical protein